MRTLKSAALTGMVAALLGACLAITTSGPAAATGIRPDSKTIVKCAKTTACFEGENSADGFGLTGLVTGSSGGSGLGASGVYGIGDGEFDNGVLGLGFASYTIGVYGISESYIGGVFESYSNTFPAFDLEQTGGGDLMDGYGSGGNFSLDRNADATFDGWVTASAYYTSLRTRGGDRVQAFGARATRETLEDTGTARLVAGESAVRFDSAFQSAVDTSRGYQVFLTPDGDTRGLYVAAKYEGGFIVREAERGRSSLYFDYRVVAHPYGTTDARLPQLALAQHRRPTKMRPPVSLPQL